MNEDILLSKWLQGEISAEELEYLGSKHDLKALEALLTNQESLDIATADPQAMWNDFSQKTIQSTELKEKKRTYSKYLVVLAAVLLGSSLLYFFKNKTTLDKTDLERKQILFADGSSATLGPNSTLSYNSSNWQDNRTLELNGQAYFEVEKGSPFKVETSAGSIQVVGTKFDVLSVSKDLLRVQCMEGSVSVQNNQGKQVVLKAQNEVYLRNGSFGKISVIQGSIPEWLNNFQRYKSVSVPEFLKDLERLYGITANSDNQAADLQFTGGIPTNNLDKAISYFADTMEFKYESQGKQITFFTQ